MYGKLFSSIYEGTLHGQWEALVTFQQMIILCNRDGIIDMTPQAIAARTSIPLEIIKNGIEALEKPDEYSRTPDLDGRRIERIEERRPWGWRIVNYAKYRGLVVEEEKRQADRDRIAAKRAAERAVRNGAENGPPESATCREVSQTVANVAHAEAEAEAEAEGVRKLIPSSGRHRKRSKRPATSLPDDFGYDEELEAYVVKRLPDVDLEAFMESYRCKARAKEWKYANWRQAFQNFVCSSAPNSGHWSSGQYPRRAAASVRETPVFR